MEFDEFIRRFAQRAYNFAYRLTGNEQDARDLLQDALVRAFERRHQYDRSKPFESWLFRIMHNIYVDGVRKHSHRPAASLDAPPPAEETSWEELLEGQDLDPADAFDRKEADFTVQRALDTLPIAYRTALVLCDMEGLSYDQISEVMSCPVGTVRSRIHQGRVLMRKAYEKLLRSGERHD